MSLGAYAYLVGTTYRNRMRMRLRRIREPRYLVGLIFGAAYLWGFLIYYPSSSGGSPSGIFLNGGVRVLATTALFAMTLSSWLFGGDRLALAFSPAEVAFLFPAPLSRRSLVGYKLFRAQFAILFNVFLWTLLLRRGGPLPLVLRALGVWMLFTTLNFHRLVAALVRTSIEEHRGHGARRHRVSIVVFVLASGAILTSLVLHRHELAAAHGPMPVARALVAALSTMPASVALWPFTTLLAPTFARDVPTWLHDAPPALLILMLNVWWVLRTDAAFEEAALAATAERAELIKQVRESRGWRRRRPVANAVRVPLHLATSGNPAVAIIWKNFICLRRTLRFQDLFPLLFPAVVVGVVSGQIGPESRGFSFAYMIAVIAMTVAILMLLFGGRIIRNDLRQDMQHIVALKTLPLRGHTIVGAEVLSAAIPIAVIQLTMLAIVGVAATFAHESELSALTAAQLWLGAVPALVAYNVANVTIQNAAPVFFPSWTRLGTTVSPGLETLGQNLVSLILILILLLLMLVVPTALGGGVWYIVRSLNTVAVFSGLVAGSAMLSVEAYAVIRVFGLAFEKTEPSQVG